MKADYRVLLDACVLANFGVCDLLLRLAEHPRLFLPVWSEEILKEVQRTQDEPLLNGIWRRQVTVLEVPQVGLIL